MGPVFLVLSKLLDVFVMPLTWALLLLVLYRVRWKGRSLPYAHVFPLAAAGVLYVFSLGAVSGLFTRGLESSARDTTKKDVTYDVIILLGGVLETGTLWSRRAPRDPSDSSDSSAATTRPIQERFEWNETVERVLVTYDWLRTGRAKDVLIAGGSVYSGGKTFREADIIADQLRAWGIDDARILLEGRSANTRENAVYSAEILRAHQYQSMVIVTSAFHMNRAIGCFRAVGLEPDTLPVDFRTHPFGDAVSPEPRIANLYESTNGLREYTGRVVYALRGFSKSSL